MISVFVAIFGFDDFDNKKLREAFLTTLIIGKMLLTEKRSFKVRRGTFYSSPRVGPQ